MDRLCVISVLTAPTPGSDAFLESLARFGVTPILIGAGHRYQGGTWKQRQIRDALIAVRRDYDVFLYADAHDSIFVQSPDECLWRFVAMDVPILFASSSVCWPTRHRASEFPDRGVYRFLSAGGIIARVEAYLELLQTVKMADAPLDTSDQRVLIHAYADKPKLFAIDSECRIFQTLFGAGRGHLSMTDGSWVNAVTGSSPCVIHADSRSRYDDVLDWLDKSTSPRPSPQSGEGVASAGGTGPESKWGAST